VVLSLDILIGHDRRPTPCLLSAQHIWGH
jgi:hypothetical protein